MKRRLSILMCALWVMVSICGSAAAKTIKPCKTGAKDETAVANTLRTMYAAATVDDMTKLHTVIAPGFYAFDDGVRYESIDILMATVKSYQDKGAKFVWNVTKPQVTIDCDNAWIAYVNNGSIQMPGATTPTPQQWLESAILKKQDGAWKLVFFHSTRVPKP